MFKKNWLIFIILLVTATPIFAGFWDDVGGCLSNPCSCIGDKPRIEQWDGAGQDKGDENPLCPPWNKTAGRGDHICLANKPYPALWVPFFSTACAEQTSESTYFHVAARVRLQVCNIACWVQVTILRGHGDCIIWPGELGIPMKRYCGRVAMSENIVPNLDPSQPDKVFPADPGYTTGKHLNFEGFEEDDKLIELEDGTKISPKRPKYCIYKDPSLYDVITGQPDLMDYNPNSQPIHNTGGVHPIGEVIILFIKNGVTTADSLGSMLASLMDSIGGVIIPGLDIFKSVFDAIGEILKYLGDAFISLIQIIFQFNRIVDGVLGCVEIPLGPYPPPYCARLSDTPISATIQNICSINPTSGNPVGANRTTKCAISNKVNNVIRNTVRIGFDNFIPICKNGEDPTKTDKCVVFQNLGTNYSANLVHILSARRDVIHVCSGSSSTNPCVQTSIAEPNSQGFRIIYGLKTGNKSAPISYYIEDDEQKIPAPIPDCGGGDPTVKACQEIWGINTGDFIDAELVFPEVEIQNAIAELHKDFTIKDTNKNPSNNTRTFTASIVRKEAAPIDGTRQSPNQICVFEAGTLVGCQQRVDAPKPILSNCSHPPVSGISCIDDFYTPKFIASLRSGSDSTNVVVGIYNAHESNPESNKINLAAYEYESFATDYNYVTQPFIGLKSYNASTIYGDYQDAKVPYDKDGNEDLTAVYLTGLEYINGKYIQGGKYSCLNVINTTHCPVDNTICILTNLLNRDLVDCSEFNKLRTNYPNLKLCNGETNCQITGNLAGKNGGAGITIYKCQPAAPAPLTYCYKNVSNIEVCKVSQKPEDRTCNPTIKPETLVPTPPCPGPSSDPVLPDALYYPASIDINAIDNTLYALRDKTPVEMGLCTTIVQPQCAEVLPPSSAYDGFATWPQAEVGEQVTGQCLPDYILPDASKPIQRYCLSNAYRREVKYEQIDPAVSCIKQEVELIIDESTNEFPGQYQYEIIKGNKEGSITFGERADSHRVNGWGKTYNIDLKFRVGHSRGLEYFRIKELTYDDYIVIKVKNNVGTRKVYSGPGNYNDISESPNDEGGRWIDASNIDLLPSVQDGENIVNMKIKVVNEGILYYVIEYKFK